MASPGTNFEVVKQVGKKDFLSRHKLFNFSRILHLLKCDPKMLLNVQ